MAKLCHRFVIHFAWSQRSFWREIEIKAQVEYFWGSVISEWYSFFSIVNHYKSIHAVQNKPFQNTQKASNGFAFVVNPINKRSHNVTVKNISETRSTKNRKRKLKNPSQFATIHQSNTTADKTKKETKATTVPSRVNFIVWLQAFSRRLKLRNSQDYGHRILMYEIFDSIQLKAI